MSKMNAFSLDFALLCDDVRREDNGKNIFIGVYLGGVTAHRSPFSGYFKLATFLTFSEAPEFEFVATSFFNGQVQSKEVFEFHPDLGEKVYLTIPVAVFDVQEDGEFEVRLEADGHEPIVAYQTWLTVENTDRESDH